MMTTVQTLNEAIIYEVFELMERKLGIVDELTTWDTYNKNCDTFKVYNTAIKSFLEINPEILETVPFKKFCELIFDTVNKHKPVWVESIRVG